MNGATGKGIAGVLVVLRGATSEGEDAIRRSAVTKARGRFAFRRLPTGEDRFYTVDARYQRGLFAGGAVSLPAGTASAPVVKTRLRVWPTTTDPSAILIRRDDKFVVLSEEGAGVLESVRVLNTSDAAYIGRAAGGRGPRPSLGLPLPDAATAEGVRIYDATIDVPELISTDFGFATTVAIPPGETQLTFGYRVEGSGGSFDLSHTALYPIVEASIYAAEPLRIESNRLEKRGEVSIRERTYTRWSTAEGLDAGDPLQAVALAQASGGLGLALGLAALGLAGAAGVLAVALARRRGPAHPVRRDRLVEAIAELDLRFKSGEISESDWSRRRTELKSRAGLGEPRARA